MDILQEKLSESIEIAMQEKIKQLEVCYKIEGKVVKVIDGTAGSYEVLINNQKSKISSMNNAKYLVGDVVYILVFNNNYSDKKILCKK